MTEQGWRDAVLEAVRRAEAGDAKALTLMAQLLTEQDTAKATLCQAGFGVTGTPWPEVVAEIIDAHRITLLPEGSVPFKEFVPFREYDGICDGCAQAESECLCDVDLADVLDCNHPSHPGCRKCEVK